MTNDVTFWKVCDYVDCIRAFLEKCACFLNDPVIGDINDDKYVWLVKVQIVKS